MTVLAFCLPSFFCLGFDEVPQVKDGKIIFIGGKTIAYYPQKILYSRPEEALKKGEPVSILEKPILLIKWKRLALIRTSNLYEGSTEEISLYDFRGKRLGPARKVVGDVFILEKVGRIFLGQRSAHYLVHESYLLDFNGNLVRVIPQAQNVWDFGFSADEVIIWIISSHVKDQKPFGQVKVIDNNGKDVETFEFFEAKNIEVHHKGHAYRIILKTPELPG